MKYKLRKYFLLINPFEGIDSYLPWNPPNDSFWPSLLLGKGRIFLRKAQELSVKQTRSPFHRLGLRNPEDQNYQLINELNKINPFSPSIADQPISFWPNPEYSIHQRSMKNRKIPRFDLLEISQSSPVVNHSDPFFIAQDCPWKVLRRNIKWTSVKRFTGSINGAFINKRDFRIYTAESSAEIRRFYIF